MPKLTSYSFQVTSSGTAACSNIRAALKTVKEAAIVADQFADEKLIKAFINEHYLASFVGFSMATKDYSTLEVLNCKLNGLAL